MNSYVKTFYKEQPSNGWHSDLEYLFDWAAKYPTNRLKENYTEFRQDYIAASIIYNPEPCGFSLLQERDCFNGMGRVLTRMFFPATLEKGLSVKTYKYSDGLRPEIYTMIDQQVEFGKKLGITDFFFSREDKKPLIIKNICDGMNRNGYDWQVAEEQYYVIGDVSQWICFTGDNSLVSA